MYVGESLCDVEDARVVAAFTELVAIAQDAP
jgi:hypothetical protein